MNNIFISYANRVNGYFPCYGGYPPPYDEHQKILNNSALAVGFDKVISWDKKKLELAGFIDPYSEPTVGDMYWSWKPFVILKTLQENPDDVVVYWDVGRSANVFNALPQRLIEWCLNHNGILPGVLVPCWGRQACWTHRDCFVYMDCDSVVYWNHPQIQASWSVWCGKQCLNFLTEWVEYCGQPRICADIPGNTCGFPNFNDFREHRRDQSVLTNLCVKHNLELFRVDHVHGDAAKNINICNSELR